MREEKKLQTIRRWFEKNGNAALKLPDGPFGPSEDTFLSLTYIEFLPHKLIMEFDTQILLVFTDIKTVSIVGPELVLTDFLQCVVDWQDFGSMDPHLASFTEGTVTLLPHQGKQYKKGGAGGQ